MFVLRELWRGNISPNERYIRKGSEYAEVLQEHTTLEQALCQALTDEQNEVYDKICGGHARMMAISEEEAFIQGFRIGARVLLDVFGSYKGEFGMIGEAG